MYYPKQDSYPLYHGSFFRIRVRLSFLSVCLLFVHFFINMYLWYSFVLCYNPLLLILGQTISPYTHFYPFFIRSFRTIIDTFLLSHSSLVVTFSTNKRKRCFVRPQTNSHRSGLTQSSFKSQLDFTLNRLRNGTYFLTTKPYRNSLPS